MHLVLDSTELKWLGEGEWCAVRRRPPKAIDSSNELATARYKLFFGLTRNFAPVPRLAMTSRCSSRITSAKESSAA